MWVWIKQGGCNYNNASIINEVYDTGLGVLSSTQRFGADIAVSKRHLSCGPRVYSASKFETVTQRSSHHQCLSNPHAPRHLLSINSPPFPAFEARFLLFISHTILLFIILLLLPWVLPPSLPLSTPSSLVSTGPRMLSLFLLPSKSLFLTS